MKLRLALTVAGIAFFSAAYSQVRQADVAGRVLDKNTIEILQRLYPGFSLSGDSAVVSDQIAKYLVLNKYLSELATTAGMDKSEDASKKAAALKEIVSEEILSESYQSQQINAIRITDQEARAFYESNKGNLFANAGTCTFFQVETSDTSAATAARIKKAVTDKIAIPDAEKLYLKVSTDVYLINYARINTANNEYPLFHEAFSGKLNTFLGPYKPKDHVGWYYIYITGRSEIGYRPYEEVKDICISQLTAIRQNAITRQWYAEALKKYPIHLSAASDKNNGYKLEKH